MRRARDAQFWIQDGKLHGISLGADFTSEHEWGIKRLRMHFGMTEEEPEKKFGIERRTIAKVPTEIIRFEETKKATTFLLTPGLRYPEFKVSSELHVMDSTWDSKTRKFEKLKYGQLTTAWDEGSFGIIAQEPQERKHLKTIYEAMLRLDLAIWVGGGGVFQNGGLVLAIPSGLPKEKLAEMRAVDLDRFELKQAAKKTGIEAELRAANKGYFALSPKWTHAIKSTANGPIETAYPVIFFLNPMEQRRYNSGYFTVEQLRHWIHERGPIVNQRT